ncbi:MAG: hypothetical protein AB7E04_09470 [Desulfobacteraceae bacterium]
MVKKQQEKKNEQKKPKSRKLIFIFIAFVLSLTVAASVTWYIYVEKDRFRPETHTYFDFPAKTQIFFYKNYPEIISLADSIDSELAEVEKESQRISNIEKEYPDQKNITGKALQKLSKIQSDSKNEMSIIINDLNSIFVQANLGSAPFEDNFINDAKAAEEKLKTLKNKITDEAKPYRSDRKKPEGIIGKIKFYIGID